jgi:hypothetical protein
MKDEKIAKLKSQISNPKQILNLKSQTNSECIVLVIDALVF